MNAIEQRREKDRIRQQRYRNKKKECNVRSIQDNNQQRITKMYEYCVTQMKMEKIMTIMLSVTLFLLLVTLQKNAYDNDIFAQFARKRFCNAFAAPTPKYEVCKI